MKMIFSAKEVMHQIQYKTDVLKMMSDEERLRLQQTLFSILIEIQDACRKIGVEFSLCGGSCLGAIRHHGFIPWDDDLDVAIMRKDWEVLKSRFEEILGEKYVLEAPDYADEDSKYPWSRIYLKGSEMMELIDINLPYHKGISIDFFVIENISANKFVRFFDSVVTAGMKYIATSMLYYKYPNKELTRFFMATFGSAVYFRIRQFLGFLFSFVSHKTWLKWYDRFASRHKGESDMVTIPTGIHLYKGELLPRSVWHPYSKTKFNGREINIPHFPEKYLTMMYGPNYMQLPPEKDRITHPIYKLKFPDDHEN